MPSRRKSSACVDYVPALCTHRPSLLPIGCAGEVFGLAERVATLAFAEKFIKPSHLEEGEVVTRFPLTFTSGRKSIASKSIG